MQQGTVNQLRRGPAADGGRDLRVIALMSTYNEGDIIWQVLRHLIEGAVSVYLIDNHSTDDTVAQASQWLGKGLLAVETFPPVADGASNPYFAWADLLKRKEQLANELDADWFLHQDADEIRESPWPGCSLKDAIRTVDNLGYNCIEFRVFHFPPVDDGFHQGVDPKAYFTLYKDASWFDFLQRKCWKAGSGPVSLTALGGHDVSFEGRRIFPVPFLLRHYPVRGQQHGVRKVFAERKARFLPAERARGWHQQYDDVTDPTHNFLADPSGLKVFDPDQVRFELLRSHAAADQPGARDPAGAASPAAVPSEPQAAPALCVSCGDDCGLALESFLQAQTERIANSIDWGNLRRLEPVSHVWGLDRGIPIDRYYIDKFLEKCRADVRGRVLEVKDPLYTLLYGTNVERSDVVDVRADNKSATLVADLSSPESLPADTYDCFVLTQTIHIIFDTARVLANARRTLRPGGVLLSSMPCVSRIDPESGLQGDSWRFTPASARRLFEQEFGEGNVVVVSFGNVLACTSFLLGLAAAELTPQELDYHDPYFPLIVCVRAQRPG